MRERDGVIKHNLRKEPRDRDHSGVKKQYAAGNEYSQDVELRKNYVGGYSNPWHDAVNKLYNSVVFKLHITSIRVGLVLTYNSSPRSNKLDVFFFLLHNRYSKPSDGVLINIRQREMKNGCDCVLLQKIVYVCMAKNLYTCRWIR